MAAASRNLLDLPDEVLCLILKYCCEDLDFLVLSRPLLATKGHPSEACRQCVQLCGSPTSCCCSSSSRSSSNSSNRNNSNNTGNRQFYNMCSISSKQHTTTSSGSPNPSNTNPGNTENPNYNSKWLHVDSNCDGGCSTDTIETILRTRRRRTIAENNQGCPPNIPGSPSSPSIGGLYFGSGRGIAFKSMGTGHLPRNGDQHRCGPCASTPLDLHNRNNTRLGSFWLRHFARFLPHPRPRAQLSRGSPAEPSIMPSSPPGTRPGSSLSPNTTSTQALLGTKTTDSIGAATTCAHARALAPIAFLESVSSPLQDDTLSNAPLRLARRCGEISAEVSRSRAAYSANNNMNKITSVQEGDRRLMSAGASSDLRSGVYTVVQHPTGTSNSLSPSRCTPSTSSSLDNTLTSMKSGQQNNRTVMSETTSSETEGDTARVSTPFQLLLVNKRLADLTVNLLWKNVVFHGHDVCDMGSLLSSLFLDSNDENDDQEDDFDRNHESVCASEAAKASLVQSYGSGTAVSVHRTATAMAMAVDDRLKCGSNTSHPISRSNRHTMATSCRYCGEQGASSSLPRNRGSECRQDRRPAARLRERGVRNCCMSASAAIIVEHEQHKSFKRRDHRHCCHLLDNASNTWPTSSRRIDDAAMHGRTTTTFTTELQTLSHRWTYSRFVRRVVLNFAHPQASSQMLVKALEAIRSRCADQIHALDLNASEKMQSAGLESPVELDRLFGTGFSQLRYLRLQGGLLDNQLLSALIKGITSRPLGPPCRLSQVFLGPGSVTDSAIDKLIAVAGHCLEVFSVTSCVDFSGTAIANLLTKCPKLRVLSVRRALARDRELLEGLGIDEGNDEVTPLLSTTSGFPGSGSLLRLPRKEITAPLERLELGTVKLTTIGVTEIIRGTCQSLRFLVLETQHFEEGFMQDVVAKLCGKLEGLHFDDTEHAPHQQQLTPAQGTSSYRRRLRRFLELMRTDAALGIHSHGHHSQDQAQSLQRQTSFLRTRTALPRQSPWLGETSTEQWVVHGDCAIWAASATESGVTTEHNGAQNTSRTNTISLLRARSLSSFFHGVSHHLASFFSRDTASVIATTATPLHSIIPLSPTLHVEEDYDRLLGRFGVKIETIDAVIQTLRPSLKSFTVSRTDMMLASLKYFSLSQVDYAGHTGSTVMRYSQRAAGMEFSANDRLDFLRLVMLMGALFLGAAASVQDTLPLR